MVWVLNVNLISLQVAVDRGIRTYVSLNVIHFTAQISPVEALLGQGWSPGEVL